MSTKTTKKMLVPALVGASALLLTACGNDGGEGTETVTSEVTTTETAASDTETETSETTSTDDTAGDQMTAEEVVAAALQEEPGDVVGLDLDLEDGDAEVTVLREDGTGVDVHVDLASGDIIRVEDENLDDDEQPAPTVDAVEAVNTALGEVPGTVHELDLGTHFGDRVWEVNVLSDDREDVEVTIDAESGEVVDTERD